MAGWVGWGWSGGRVFGESVVEEVTKEVALLLAAMEEVEPEEAMVVQPYDEDIPAWAEAVRGWLKHQQADQVSFTEMIKRVKLSFVRIWLALLLDRFDLRQDGDFYDCAGIMISLR